MATLTTSNLEIANRTAIALRSGFDTYVIKGDLIFNDTPPTRFNEIMSIHAHDGGFDAVAESANYPEVTIQTVGSKTFTQIEYKKKLVISQMLKRFDSEGALYREAMKIGMDGAIKIDQLLADVFNNGFTTETAWDGDALFSASHNIGSTGLTQSNLATGALTDANFNAGRVLMMNFKNHRNTANPVPVRNAIVGTALETKIKQLLWSEGNPESGNRNLNTYKQEGITPIVWELLTSTTAWFLTGDKLHHELHKFQALPLKVQTRPALMSENGSEEVRCDFSQIAGAGDYLGLVGSNGL